MAIIHNAAKSQETYQLVNERLCGQLARGIIPWHQTFLEIPCGINGGPFWGVNIWLLAGLGYTRNLFLTTDQICKHSLTINQGESGHLIVYWTEEDGQVFLTHDVAFNIAQVSGFRPEQVPRNLEPGEPMQLCKAVLQRMPDVPAIVDFGSSVFYQRSADIIYLPKREKFENDAQWFSSLFYPLAESTGHGNRLGWDARPERKLSDPKIYSLESLIAEMCCSSLCSFGEIEPWYLKKYHADSEGWLHALERDATLAVAAGAHLKQVVQYMLSLAEFEKRNHIQCVPKTHN